MKTEEKLITPAIATEMLQSNIKNRRVKAPVVLRYAADMANGRWKKNTFELIKISKTGIILDGQHRLLAVVKSNVPVYFHLATGLDDNIFDVLDTGSSRNAADSFKIAGIKNSNILPSIISFHFLLIEKRQAITQKNLRLTNAESLSEFYRNESFWIDVSDKTINWYSHFGKILPPSVIGGFYSFLQSKSKADAVEFMNQLCDGINIKNNTINILRNKLMQDKLALRKMPLFAKNILIIKTWNCFRKNETLKILKIDTERENILVAV